MAAPPPLAAALDGAFNDSQREAITAGLNSGSRLVLVQGPPGTGKTKTILGLLSVLAAAIPADSPSLLKASGGGGGGGGCGRSTAEWRDLRRRASPWACSGFKARVGAGRAPLPILPHGSGGRAADPLFGLGPAAPPLVVSAAQQRRPHVLVCAPSNGALDEIVIRVVRDGLTDGRGRAWKPRVVRVGVSVHHTLSHVSLEALVQAKMADHQGGEARQERGERERLQTELLDGADVICSTLSFAGSGVFARMARPLDALVVDEAAQAVEPACLIPMALGITQVFLVGDPTQLPATVISDAARQHGYATSLFQRLQTAGHPVQMLDTQYRMHPTICGFISRQFYGGRVRDDPGVALRTTAPWHRAPCLGPLAFFDVRGKEAQEGSSLVNRVEAEMVLCLYKELTAAEPRLRTSPAIAVISPYKAQVNLLREKFKLALGNDYQHLDIDTIDGFQGREKEVCIFTTVRSRLKGGIGFVADARRINVGLSRARSSLLMVGNAAALRKDRQWAGVVSYSDSISCLFQATKPFLPFLEALAGGGGRALAEAARALTPDGYTAEPEAGSYDDDDDAYSDYDEMPATMSAPTAYAAAPVAHSTLSGGEAGRRAARPRGAAAKRKAG